MSHVISLYRRILRLHSRLPQDLKDIGVAYVRDEFKRHKDVTDSQIRGEFMSEWRAFALSLEEQLNDGSRLGKKLDSKEMDLLSDGQLKQLADLYYETRKPS